MKIFDYYIFIDFSENLIGYNIISSKKMFELLPKIVKLKHYKQLKHKREYLSSMKKLFVKEKINSYLEKTKIKKVQKNMDIFAEVLEFVKKHEDCIVFLSVDDFQYRAFRKILKIIDGKKTEVVKESQIKKGTPEYQMSLIIDTQLNLIRRQK
ncbi:MAG: hypothetical protein PVJ67_05950 [Candidatus Pacearchaeota archaeon]|jgi:hypothetical protein